MKDQLGEIPSGDISEAERTFVDQVDVTKQLIMGVHFATVENFWQARDTLIDSIYEGLYPDKSDVLMLKARIEQRFTSDEIIAKLKKEVCQEEGN